MPFPSAIDLSKNRKYLRYALPPLLLLIVILFINANLITDSTARIINNNKNFEPGAFFLPGGTDQLKAVQFEDFPLPLWWKGATAQ